MTPSDLLERAQHFRLRIEELKRARAGVAWYPYDSLSNFIHLSRLLSPLGRNLLDLLPDRAVLDAGTSDGDAAFFLESLGYDVDAIDMEYGNYSALRGFRALHESLNSRVQLHEMDLDKQFELGEKRYSLALSLGLLYHLKNPFYFLETLSRQAHFCLLSTKIADSFGSGLRKDRRDLPLAYLLSGDELNEDDSNYWVFTEACVARLVDRAGWVMLNALRAGLTRSARAGSVKDDSRLFAVLASRRLPVTVLRGTGWMEPEDTGWRWTEQRFTLKMVLRPLRPHRLALAVFVAPALLAEGPNSITCHAAGRRQERVLNTPGKATLLFDLPEAWRGDADLELEFSLARPPAPPPGEKRRLGLIVADAELRPVT